MSIKELVWWRHWQRNGFDRDKTSCQTISSQVSPWLKICLHRTWHLLAPFAKQGWRSSEVDNSTGKGRTIIHLWFLWQPYSCFVTLLSPMHHDTRVEGDDKKPHIIQHYNACKGGVDVMDKLATTYSCRRKINRWPMTLYFNMVDVSCTTEPSQREKPQAEVLSAVSCITWAAVSWRSHTTEASESPTSAEGRQGRTGTSWLHNCTDRTCYQPPSKRRCVLCHRHLDRKVRQMCTSCNRNMCKEHSSSQNWATCWIQWLWMRAIFTSQWHVQF